jgi:hypothetical protein
MMIKSTMILLKQPVMKLHKLILMLHLATLTPPQ